QYPGGALRRFRWQRYRPRRRHERIPRIHRGADDLGGALSTTGRDRLPGMTAADSGTPADSQIAPSAASPYWRGAYTWVRDGQWWRPWRLPPDRAPRAHAADLIHKAQMAAGVRAECTTDAEALSLDLTVNEMPDKPSVLDVTVDGALGERVHLTNGEHTIECSLPPGSHDVTVWLPQAGLTAVGPLQLHGHTRTTPQRSRPQWV